MTLGENIVRLRTQKNWSQGDLADALDISRQSVSKWETDASIPELDKLLKLSELFGVTLDELVRGEDAPKSETAAARGTGSTRLFHAADSSEQEKRHTIAGTILMCIGAVLLLTCLILAGDLAEQHAHIYGCTSTGSAPEDALDASTRSSVSFSAACSAGPAPQCTAGRRGRGCPPSSADPRS